MSQHRLRPWPWTLNIDGEGHYYPSRHAAWIALKKALLNTNASVDIGLMQVNWRYHHQKLGSAWQALDPYHNLRVAASLLQACYHAKKHWGQSLGCYHSPNHQGRARRYRHRVQEHWRRLTGKTDQEIMTNDD